MKEPIQENGTGSLGTPNRNNADDNVDQQHIVKIEESLGGNAVITNQSFQTKPEVRYLFDLNLKKKMMIMPNSLCGKMYIT
ncbi:hypothetical protein LIER_10760 [Lithospermum erythrorhizon]|uniref:Uncharacterized protein n=1 Tax=Lithospermum erythrorhizon TaxID=34254 RepID=A0AAV3PKS6_LITER